MTGSSMERREFLRLAGAAAVATRGGAGVRAVGTRVEIVVDPADAIAASAPVGWAVKRLRAALAEKGAEVEVVSAAPAAKGKGLLIVVAGDAAMTKAESLRIMPRRSGARDELWASGGDVRGLQYAVLELADRIELAGDGGLGLTFAETVEEAPANRVRSVARAFCSEVEDKPWYYDKSFWTGYLDMLAVNRFNRFNLAFGFGYDFPKGVTDDYFHFPYPYLVEVPGYDVRVVPLAEGERARNFEMLRFIAAETAARGLQFQLGIWTHAYAWTDSPNAAHRIDGLTAETHAKYCRDALAILLRECKEIEGLTMRVHGESGIPEGSYGFWSTLFEAVAGCGRKIEIDMHAKGINQIMIDMAVKTGMRVKVSPKYSAEHMGLGYHQADIRELEIPRPERMETGVFSVSNGDRRFTRYGYADLYQEGREFDLLYRLWPGTQRHLLWGDPETAAGYGRTAHFCNAAGLELCEPLTFKGREGSGIAGGRLAYADKTLVPKQDWEKFAYSYRVWGRLLYNPDCDLDVWRRWLKREFGRNAEAAETAMTNASRILPLVTTAQMSSASNHSYWPEIYENMPIVIGSGPSPYSDTPTPRCFATVSALDPQLFSSIRELAGDVLEGRTSAMYSPIEVASWLEALADAAAQADDRVAGTGSSGLSRWREDVRIQVGLGRFFAAKLRSGFAWELFERSGSVAAGELAVAKYQEARDAWAVIAKRADKVYVADISYGSTPGRRGNWRKRLPAIDRDLGAMRQALTKAVAGAPNAAAQSGLRMAAMKVPPGAAEGKHVAPESFRPGEALELRFDAQRDATVLLAYRHVNHGERWQSLAMSGNGREHAGTIPGEYTRSPYPLQYYFVVSKVDGMSEFFPGLGATLSRQPYFAVWQRV